MVVPQNSQPSLALVDGDPAVRNALRFAFETAGISVAAFSDGETALAAADQAKWRCVVLDQRLPGMTGLELLQRLRERGVLAPAIMITTQPSRETIARSRAAGVEIVEKPLLDDALTARVHGLIWA
jgi:DNA-binding response OmpR family regulator